MSLKITLKSRFWHKNLIILPYTRMCDVVKDITCHSGDNCIQNFHLRRYIVGYTVGNLVLQRRASRAVKRDFLTCIQRYTSPNENFEYGYPHSNALLQFYLHFAHYMVHKASCHLTKFNVINDVKLFLTVYRKYTVINF